MRYLSALIAGILLCVIHITASAETKNIDMFAGEVKIIDDIRPARVAIGLGTLIKVEVLPNDQLLIIAEKPGSTYLHVWTKEGEELDYNLRIAEYDPETRVMLKDMIEMEVRIIEFRKAALGQLGINWAKDINGPSFGIAGNLISNPLFGQTVENSIFSNLPRNVEPFQIHFGIASEITSRINYLASTGDAVTLAEPKLSCRNGGTAKFLAGGEVPYPVTGDDGQTSVEFKEYGVKLNIAPLADSSGHILAQVLTEVSQIDPAVNVLGAPGFLTRKTETEMNVLEGETIVIAGLLSAESSDDVDKVAGLGDIPILGSLFRSKNYRHQLTELVIFVTPRILRVQSSRNQDVINKTQEKIKKRLETLEEKLDYGIMD